MDKTIASTGDAALVLKDTAATTDTKPQLGKLD